MELRSLPLNGAEAETDEKAEPPSESGPFNPAIPVQYSGDGGPER